MEVARGVYRLTQGVVNFYLVEEGGKLVVIDAGAPRDWDTLVRSVSALGRELADIEAVLITHAHSDHAGFAERARTTAAAPVWIHQGDAPGPFTPPGIPLAAQHSCWRLAGFCSRATCSPRGIR